MKVSHSRYYSIAKESIGAFKAVYISGSNEVKKAKADSENTVPCIGFTDESVSIDESVLITTNDVLDGFTGLTPGSEYWLSQITSSEITSTMPSNGIRIRVGVALTATKLDIHILRINNNICSNDINLQFSSTAGRFIEMAATDEYGTIDELQFRGTDYIGTPVHIKARLSSTVVGNIQWRIYDVDNDKVICEGTAQSMITPMWYDFGILSNLPTNDSEWHIQVKEVPTGAGKSRIHFLRIGF